MLELAGKTVWTNTKLGYTTDKYTNGFWSKLDKNFNSRNDVLESGFKFIKEAVVNWYLKQQIN